MSNNNGYGNEFMDTIVQNNDLSKKNSVPEVQHVVMLYAKNLYDNTADELSGWKKGLAFLLRIVHIFGIFFICSGWLLPSKLLILHILFCLKTLFLWGSLRGHIRHQEVLSREEDLLPPTTRPSAYASLEQRGV